MTKAQQPYKDFRYLFVSDVHLGGFSAEKNLEIEQAFLSLMAFARAENLTVVIVGDLFDYWMEVGTHLPQVGKNVCAFFKKWHKETGISTPYVTGNHDNWTYGYLEHEVGFTIAPDVFWLPLHEGRALLYHGDGLPDANFTMHRPFFHRFLRNPYFTSLYRMLLPAKTAVWLMKWFSRTNRSLSKDSNARRIAEIDSKARELLEQELCEAVLCGHHHQAVHATYNNRVYLNTGNFFRDRNVGLYVNRTFQLATWNDRDHVLETR